MKKRTISNSTQTAINMVASMATYGITLLVSFFLSPFIVKNIGVDANGFIGLAGNFTGYASLITIALNTLSSRFVTVSLYQNDEKKANQYFSSVVFANIFIAFLLAIAGTVVIVWLDSFLDVSQSILPDVRLLFAVLFLNSIVGTIGSLYSVAAFATNKLYLSSIITILANILRVLALIVFFSAFTPKLYYVGISTFVSTVFVVIANFFLTKKLLPQIKVKFKEFDFKKIKELVGGGIWNSVNKLGQILLSDLDLLISNLFIDSVAMGVLSLSKTVPNGIGGIIGTIANIFIPNYTILYAQGKHEELIRNIKQSMKIMGVLVNIPIIVLYTCGEQFYTLWQPTQNARTLYYLSILGISTYIISGGINCLYNIFTVVNKLRLNAIVVVASGAINTLLVYIILQNTNWGIYAVAGVSTVLSIIRNLVFTAPYGAYCLKLKWYTFFPDIIRPALFFTVSVLVTYFPAKYIFRGSWMTLILSGIVVVSISFILGYFVVMGKEERAIIKSKLLGKFIRKGEQDA